MNQKTKIEQARADFIKTVRTAVRLKHSLHADAELNELLPEKMKMFEKLIQKGILPSPIDIKALTAGLDGK